MQRAPPTPPPVEDKLFTDWSSLDSPCVRLSSQTRETGQDINQPDNQTIQPGAEPAQVADMDNTHHDDMTSSSTH